MTSSAALITIPRTPSDIGRVTRKPQCNTWSLSLSPIDAAILRILPTPSRIVFPFKQSYFHPVNGSRLPALEARREGRLSMSFVIAHITDPHLSPAPMPGFADLRLKRVMGFINWKRGRERLNDMGLLKRLGEDLCAQRPDHVAVTGDLVNIGMPIEFHRAALWMETLGEPSDVSFVPGNHDAYVRASMTLLATTFAPWATSDGAPERQATYPYLRVRGEIAIIGLSSAVPTAPLMATGRLGKRQLEAFAGFLGGNRAQ